MKVTCHFDKETRSLELTPEDSLESLIVEDLCKRCSSGQTLRVSQVVTEDPLKLKLILMMNTK